MYKEPEPDEFAERSVLSGILHYGDDAYLDTVDILTPQSFTQSLNQVLYNCIDHAYRGQGEIKKIDSGTILSAAKELGYAEILDNRTSAEYVRALFNHGHTIEIETVRNLAGKLRKLQIARDMQRAVLEAAKDIGNVTGTESPEEILSIAENSITKEIDKLFGQNGLQTKQLGQGVDEWLQNIIDNPSENYGIDTGYKEYNKAIGGGFIRKELDIICGRGKSGKSMCADNIGFFIAKNFNIPILNIDTELSQEQHWIRMLALISGVDMTVIKTGQFAKNPELKQRVLNAKEILKEIPYYYECVGGRTFEEIISIMRRWIQKHVGLDANGNRNDCLIIYDYIKMLGEDGISQNMQEYQKLGFMVTTLKNFIIRHDVPMLAFAQLNRDGIDGNSTGAVAGSDRILMYCSSLSFFKAKTEEEIQEDGGLTIGNRKLLVLAARNGPGTDEGDYINMNFDKGIARITEGKLASIIKLDRADKEGFDTTLEEDETVEL
jgi:replicative DNA helicase